MAYISRKTPRPEHPRPLLERKKWINLNGQWQFAFDDANSGIRDRWFGDHTLPTTITVPFAYQTIASGVNDHSVHEIVWYKRTFQKPEHQPDENILLHFGAVDFQSTVWINNQEIGGNTGGHVPFSFDITPYVTAGENTLTVRVYDGQDARQPRGKQSVSGRSEYIDYHCTTGIWQTVWLEVVPIMRIDDIRITPLVQENCFSITSILHAPTMRWQLEIAIFDEGHEIVRVSKESNAAVISMRIPLDYPKLWSPDNPHLYTFEVSLASNGKVHDCITSYGGLREIRIDGNTLLFNNEPLYLAMVLDQGYWPESGLTAPTDAAMRKDVQIMKRYGFNGCRKHQKIEDPRWLYWCDKLGLLVWSEMANARAWDSQAEQWLLAEWERAIRRDYNHPSIVAWVPMNESWGVSGLHDDHPGQFAYIEHIVTTTRRLDSTRPVVDNDGWEHTDITDMCTLHDYTPNSSKLKDRYHSMITEGSLPEKRWVGDMVRHFARSSQYHGQPIIFTEFGGLLLAPKDTQQQNIDKLFKIYGTAATPADVAAMYEDLMQGLSELSFLSGYCYTQLVDVEQEINGLLTYDRRPKLPAKRVAAWNKRLIKNYRSRTRVY